jgi:hypothetical protein
MEGRLVVLEYFVDPKLVDHGGTPCVARLMMVPICDMSNTICVHP